MERPTRFYSSLGLLIVLNALIKPAWVFVIDRQVQNEVGVSIYGAYFSLLSLSVVFSFLLDWGLTVFFNRQLAIQDQSFLHQPGNFLLVKLLFALQYTVLVFAAAAIAGIERWDILAAVVIIQILSSLFLFLRAIVTAHQWFRQDAWLSIIDKGLMILLGGTLLYFPAWLGGISIERFGWLQVGCLLVAVLLSVGLLLARNIRFTIRRPAFPSRELFRMAAPYALAVLLMSAHSRLDAFLLDRLNNNGAYEAGIYAAAYRLLDAGNIVGFLVAAFLLPFIAREWSKKKNIGELLLPARHFLLMFAIGVSSITIFMAPWIQDILYHHQDDKAVSVLQWCLPALIGYSLTHIYGTALTATGYIASFCKMLIASVALNLVLNLLLIPSLGAMGCCIAALSSQVLTGIGVTMYARQKLQINLHSRSLVIYLLTAVLLCGGLYLAGQHNINKWWLIGGATMTTLLIMLWAGFFKPGLLRMRG